MYQRFYDLQEMPFELTPDPRYLYLSRQHREALSNLEYGLLAAKGITVLVGEAGTGKTTLLHAMLGSPRCRHVSSVFITNPTLTRAEFVEMLSKRFKLSAHAGESKAALLAELDTMLRERRAAGHCTALVIDEAQSLTPELLEEIRLLANSETSTQKLLPLVLVGQPELRERLNEPGLRQLKQRITLRCEIKPLTLAETADYIATRARTAGGNAAHLFTRDAVMLIYERSGGIPRTISVLCDNALLTGCGLGQRPVTRDIVVEVARDFDLLENAAVAGPIPENSVSQKPYFEIAPPTREVEIDIGPARDLKPTPRQPESPEADDDLEAPPAAEPEPQEAGSKGWRRWLDGLRHASRFARPALVDSRNYAAGGGAFEGHHESR